MSELTTLESLPAVIREAVFDTHRLVITRRWDGLRESVFLDLAEGGAILWS
jgi:hypothetical protein